MVGSNVSNFGSTNRPINQPINQEVILSWVLEFNPTFARTRPVLGVAPLYEPVAVQRWKDHAVHSELDVVGRSRLIQWTVWLHVPLVATQASFTILRRVVVSKTDAFFGSTSRAQEVGQPANPYWHLGTGRRLLEAPQAHEAPGSQDVGDDVNESGRRLGTFLTRPRGGETCHF